MIAVVLLAVKMFASGAVAGYALGAWVERRRRASIGRVPTRYLSWGCE